MTEELKQAIEHDALKAFRNGDGNDTRFDYLQEHRREAFIEGAREAISNPAIYEAAGLVKVNNNNE